MKKFVEVPYEEYVAFLAVYPNKLVFGCNGMAEPPIGTYNDFSDGKVWPESVVAKEVRGWLGDNGEIDNSVPGKYWEYFVSA